MALRIEDYALIGNLYTAALVGKNGSIDWMCLPRFDSPACFAALLGEPQNGYWAITPLADYTVSRRYREKTLILETSFRTSGGAATLIDCMVPRHHGADLIRIIRGDAGEVPLGLDLTIRFDYGSRMPWVTHSPQEVMAIAGPDMLHLYSSAKSNITVPLEAENERTHAEFSVKKGQILPFVLNWHPSHERPPRHIEKPEESVAATARWWEAWASRTTYEGEWPELVERSAITLKALTYRPTGGVLAAATTSLPEQIGGERNWDYRYCWLRDSTFTLYALMTTGHIDEARAWRDWLLRAVAGEPNEVQIMYDLAGGRRLPELTLDWLSGYEHSQPVRVGNAASGQLQLDVIGEVMDSFHLARRSKLEPSPLWWDMEKNLLEYLEGVWELPDRGLWEVRGPARHFTHSKVMAWVALDRGIKAIEHFGRKGPVEHWRALANTIRNEILSQGFNAKIGSFVQYYGSNRLDASLLILPLVGFIDVNDPRMLGTIAAIERNLIDEGFALRYRHDAYGADEIDGLRGPEGTFIPCTFWLADNYALLGRNADARALFNRAAAIRNDVGLLAEEYDPRQKRQLGNFPQAFSHVALINSARNLSHQAGGAAYDRKAA